MDIKYIQFNEVEKSYKTVANAKKALELKLSKRTGYTRATIIVREDGRFVPVVIWDRNGEHDMGSFVHNGVCIVG